MKIYYYLSKSKTQRIELETPDINALLFLNEQGILSQPQFHEFYSISKKISEAAFRRKMSRWNTAKIISKSKVKMQSGYEMAIINLTAAGQNILKKAGYLQMDEKLKYQAKTNLDHTLSIKQSVIEVLKISSKINPYYIADGGKYLISFKDNYKGGFEEPIILFKKQDFGNDSIPHLQSLIKSNNALIVKLKELGALQSFLPQDFQNTNDHLGDKDIGLTPDWIFKIQDTFLYIEVDSGSEKIKIKRDDTRSIIDKHDVKSIEGKLYRYEKLAKENNGHKHIVIFSLMDDSKVVITKNLHTNKDKRIANLKHDIAHMDDYSKWNIDVYVIGMKRYYSLIKSIYIQLFNSKKLDTHDIYKQAFIKLIQAGLKPNWESTKYSIVLKQNYAELGIFTDSLNFTPEVLFRYRQATENRYQQFLIPIFMREGNVKDMEILAYYTIPIADGRFGYNTKILALYETRNQLFNDILRKTMKVTTNKITGELIDNNGMDVDNIIFAAQDELTRGILRLYKASGNIIDKSELF
jgi:hypothetical protein